MKNFGFVKVAAAIPYGKVAGVEYNKREIIKMIFEASQNNASIIVFPELTITSYTCGDLFQQTLLIEESQSAILEIRDATKDLAITSIIGLPFINNNKLFNCAAILNRGQIIGIVPKTFIPGYKEFYEPRWFASSDIGYDKTVKIDGKDIPFGTDILFRDKNNKNLVIGVEICEDVWVAIPPSSYQCLAGATIICNLSASNVLVAKSEYRRELIKNQSGRCVAGYIYVSAGMGESTTDVVFDADAVIAENSAILCESERFLRKNQIIYSEIDTDKLVTERIKLTSFGNSIKDFRFVEFQSSNEQIEITRFIEPHPFIPKEKGKLDIRCKEIFNIQVAGLAKRLESINGAKAVIGVSGGLDSTLALLVTIKTFKLLNKDLKDIICVTMPGFGTTDTTYNTAKDLCQKLGVTLLEIGIKNLSNTLFKDIAFPENLHDVTYENVQARARTYILMSVANKENGIVIGTGDLSEIALGWCTYNGDHISMYNVNSSIPKTLVKFLIKWVSLTEFDSDIQKILSTIIELPISPELLPSDGKTFTQKTEEKIGPYELHDFFLYYFVRYGFTIDKIFFLAKKAFEDSYDEDTIKKWLSTFYKRFFTNQWKRDCVPAGVKVGSIDLSPRGSWRMPADCNFDDFIW
ncbi:MAG: NAD(+) synthase [Spirochaetes bacterium GWD1_27_9]|nr:MAG: NAD(+) synthase [Spirochaetes bacterium GWB1_27_13]OHD26427.1 MAG: NAD(+) synthase [Spirochaetes bacterium GWC1_27_15]OHD34501.1 MAG: NAD(+) synthase [Spirochaetes bacterium GWD1_27_9]